MSTANERNFQPGAILWEDQTIRVGFAQVSWLLIGDASLSDQALRTYLALMRHAFGKDAVFPGQERLALLRGVSARSIHTHLLELEARGLIVIEPQQPPERPTNTYRLRNLSAVYTEEEVTRAETVPTTSDLRKWASDKSRKFSSDRGQKKTSDRGQKFSSVEERENGKTDGAGKAASRFLGGPSEDEDGGLEGKEGETASGSLVVPLAPVPPEVSAAFSAPEVPAFSLAPPARGGASKPEPAAPAPKKAPPPPPTKMWVRKDGEEKKDEDTVEEPKNGGHVYQLWLAEMQRKDPGFMDGKRALGTPKDMKIGSDLLKKFPPSLSDDLLLKMIRVAVWDWTAITQSFEWYAKGKPYPTLKEILYLADTLAGAVSKGIIAPPGIRTSAYAERWLKEATTEAAPAGVDPIADRCRRESKGRAQVIREMRKEEEEARRAARDRATG